jgi:acyl-coenzyme A synthetase/AMP-(fatty) acid ligase
MLAFIGYRPDDVYLTTGPLYHSGPGGFMGIALAMGQTIVLQHKFDPEDWLRLVETYRCTSTFAAPTPIRMICNLPNDVLERYDRSSMRIMIANAAPWSFALKQQYVDDFPPESLFEVYGSTELGVNTILRPEDQMRKPGSCGKEAPMVEIRLYDEQGERRHRHRSGGRRRAVRAVAVGVRRLLQAARQVRRGPPRRLPDRR